MGGRQSVQIASIVTQILIDFLMEIKLCKQKKSIPTVVRHKEVVKEEDTNQNSNKETFLTWFFKTKSQFLKLW